MLRTVDPPVHGHPRRPLGHRLAAALSCLVLILLSTIGLQGTAVARADDKTPSSWSIPEYRLTADVDRAGDARVTLDMSFDFADDKGHGPYVTFVKRQKLTDDPNHWRMVDYSDFTASSPTGANSDLQVTSKSSAVQIRIGSSHKSYTGIQKYRISFTVHGLIALKNSTSGLDEFNWRIFDGFDVPIDAATVQVTGPAGVSRAACFQGASCSASSSGRTATFTTGHISAGRPLQVVAGFPSGTFSDEAAARLAKRFNLGNTFGLNPASGIGAVLAALLAGWAAVRNSRKGRDREFVGVPPGVIPPEGQGQVRIRRKDPEVAVAFRPPDDVSPAEAGTLLDGSADAEDVTAAILDLSVRGHLTISPEDADRKGRTKNWRFTLDHRCPDPLRDWESRCLDLFFENGSPITTEQMRKQHDNRTLSVTTETLNHKMKKYGWYDAEPSTLRLKSFGMGMAVVGIGALVAVLGAFLGWGLIGVPVILVGIVMAVIGLKRSPGRTATGTAVLDQIRGFRLYLTTAEADQIRFEEGIDVFSRYLPWATVFGVADRWVKIFQDLEARNAYHANYAWYGGDYNAFSTGFAFGFGSALSDMSSAMASSMQAASSSSTSSSGGGFSGSGFSGGGGFGGGGGGGW